MLTRHKKSGQPHNGQPLAPSDIIALKGRKRSASMKKHNQTTMNSISKNHKSDKSQNPAKNPISSLYRVRMDDIRLLRRISNRAAVEEALIKALERDVSMSAYDVMVSAAASNINDAAAVYPLGYAAAYNTLDKVLDPRSSVDARKRLATDAPDDNGHAENLARARHNVTTARAYLDALGHASNAATRLDVIKAGDNLGKYRTVTADSRALADYNALITDTVPADGLDYVHDALVALYELAAVACDRHGIDRTRSPRVRREILVKEFPGWLTESYTVRELARRVYIRLSDSAAYRDRETRALVEIYRAVRNAIRDNRAARADISGYTYISLSDVADNDATAAKLDGILYRSGKYADIGGYAADKSAAGLYTSDGVDSVRAASMRERIESELSPQQLSVLRLRLKGFGKKAIASYLGVKTQSIERQLDRIRDKARALGFNPHKPRNRAELADILSAGLAAIDD